MKYPLDLEYVEKYCKSWEERHDEWVVNFLAPAISSQEKTLSGLKTNLKSFILNDWRGGFAFFIDRTSYQGGVRSDSINYKIAIYLVIIQHKLF